MILFTGPGVSIIFGLTPYVLMLFLSGWSKWQKCAIYYKLRGWILFSGAAIHWAYCVSDSVDLDSTRYINSLVITYCTSTKSSA